MITIQRTGALLLCAGLSRRFGDKDKLAAPLGDRPLALHAATTVGSLPFGRKVAIVSAETSPSLCASLAALGYELLPNDCPEEGKDRSIRIGLSVLIEDGIDGILVCLGDMPHVEAAHLARLAETATDEQGAISSDGTIRLPPVLIPSALGRRILGHSDHEVRSFMSDCLAVEARPETLFDYDTEKDFARRQS